MISVITVTYNNYDDLHRTLNSLKNVDGIESVVVNGGDCNKTKKLLSNYDGIAISEPDNGISDAFNKGGPRSARRNQSQRNSNTAIKPTQPISIQMVRGALCELMASLYHGLFKCAISLDLLNTS